MLDRPNIITTLFILLMSALAGLARFATALLKEKTPEVITRNYMLIKTVHVIAHMVISAFAGLTISFLIWDYVDSQYTIIAISSIGAHGGAKTLEDLAKYFASRYAK